VPPTRRVQHVMKEEVQCAHLQRGLVLLGPPGSGARGGGGRRGRLTLYLTGRGQDLGLTLVAVGRSGRDWTAGGDRGQKSHPVRRDVREVAQCCSASDCTCAGLITQRQLRRRRTYGNVRPTERIWFLQVGVQEPS